MLFTRLCIRFVSHMFCCCCCCCFWFALGMFCFHLRITYGFVFFCLDTVLLVGIFGGGEISLLLLA